MLQTLSSSEKNINLCGPRAQTLKQPRFAWKDQKSWSFPKPEVSIVTGTVKGTPSEIAGIVLITLPLYN